MKFFKSWKTSVLGVTSLIVAALVAFGVFTPEDASQANQAIVGLVEQIGTIILTITGIIGLFTRDNDITDEESGATEAAHMRSLNS